MDTILVRVSIASTLKAVAVCLQSYSDVLRLLHTEEFSTEVK